MKKFCKVKETNYIYYDYVVMKCSEQANLQRQKLGVCVCVCGGVLKGSGNGHKIWG